MKKIILIMLLLISSAYAIEECLDEEDIGNTCMIITPVTVNASNQNQVYVNQICNATIYNSTDLISNKLMTNSTYGEGVHNISFSEVDLGIYTVNVLCNASSDYGRWSKEITITDTLDKKIDSNFTTTLNKIDSINTSANVTDILARIGDPISNSTSLWDFLFVPDSSLDIPGFSFCSDNNLISKNWCFIYRVIHGTIP